MLDDPSPHLVSRRSLKDARLAERLARESAGQAADGVHARRLRAWAGDDDSPYPTRAESCRIAAEELATLIDALSDLATVDPRRFRRDVETARWHDQDFRGDW